MARKQKGPPKGALLQVARTVRSANDRHLLALVALVQGRQARADGGRSLNERSSRPEVGRPLGALSAFWPSLSAHRRRLLALRPLISASRRGSGFRRRTRRWRGSALRHRELD